MSEIKKAFLALDNNFFTYNESDLNFFERYKTDGFTVYSYILYSRNISGVTQCTIKDIISFLNCQGMKDKRTIERLLIRLHKNKLINIQNIKPKIGLNDSLIIQLNISEMKNGFTPMSSNLFIDKISKIGHVGWSILCLLTKLHNKNFGGLGCVGYATPTEEYIGKVVNRHVSSVKNYLQILEQNRLIKIIPQDPIYLDNEEGYEIVKYLPNKYEIKNKMTGTKYYLDM